MNEEGIPFAGKFGPTIQSFLLKVKYYIQINSDIHNPIVMFPFTVFHGKYPFWLNCQFKLKYGSYSNWNMQNSLLVFYHFGRKYPFWANLVNKIKNVSLS